MQKDRAEGMGGGRQWKKIEGVQSNSKRAIANDNDDKIESCLSTLTHATFPISILFFVVVLLYALIAPDTATNSHYSY